MLILGLKRVVSLMLVAVCYASAVPVSASTDDNGKNEPPAKPRATKVDAPAPLTERERWLLDRVEELEKRVADLESKSDTAAVSAANVPAAQPSPPNVATSVVAAIPGVAPGSTTVNPVA